MTVTPQTPWPDVAMHTNRATVNGQENVEIVSYPYHSIYYYEQGMDISYALGRYNGQWFTLGVAQWGSLYEMYYVPVVYDSGSNTFIPDGAPTKLYETTDWSQVTASNGMFYTDDGRVIYKTTYDYPAVLDLATLTMTITPGISRSGHFGLDYFDSDIKPLSFVSSTRKVDLATATDTQAAWESLRANGLPINVLDRNLSNAPVFTAPLTFLPELTSTDWRISDQTRDIFGTDFNKQVCYLYYWQDDAGVKHPINIMMIVDRENATVTEFDLEPILNTGPCPLAPIDLVDTGFMQKQAYAVNGRITVSNQSAEVDVVLVDNTSKRIIGRTKSDPITGNYSFRCWTPGKKSIFAIHPETKALRMAAQRTPVAVG